MLQKIGGDKYIGVGLYSEFEKILNENILTPGDAVQKVNEHLKKVNKFVAAVQNAITSFETLGINIDCTKEKKYEIGFLMPCKLLNNN